MLYLINNKIMEKKIFSAQDSLVDLFMLVDDEDIRRDLFDLFYYLEPEYQIVLAKELRHLLLTGHETVWVRSRLLLRFYCIAKRLMGFPADESDFDLRFYHEIEKYHSTAKEG